MRVCWPAATRSAVFRGRARCQAAVSWLRPLPAAGAFDAVACCFFLDTAHNVLEYLEVIWHCLRPGGYFVNLGPLLYHWADAPGEELSVELSLEEVKAAAAQVGLIPAWAKAAGWAARVQGSGVGSKGAGQWQQT